MTDNKRRTPSDAKNPHCQVSLHLAKRFRKRRFRTRPIRNKNCLWWPCLLTHRDEMRNLYRGPSIDASYQVSVHLAKRFRRRRFKKNRSIKNKNCLWRPCLLTDRDEMSNLYRGPSIDASYQVSVHLIKRFRRRFKKIGQSETRIACGGHVC
jgi:predicted aminopeptidase